MARNKLKGIGGWLIVAFLQLIAFSLGNLYSLFVLSTASPEISYLHLYAIFSLGLFVFTLIFGFMQKKEAILLFILSHSINLLISIFFIFYSGFTYDLGVSAIVSSLWIWYFKASERVKNTFVK